MAPRYVQSAATTCWLGWVRIAATPAGLCALLLGDDDDTLLAELRHRFPRATMAAASPAVQGWAAQIAAWLDDPRAELPLPLDVHGTPFQRRVWEALRTIPPGQTIGYGELAQRLGMPRAARAVAQACAANPLAVAIPCHRVVSANGSLCGYRWGLARKQALLKREAGI
ncbi:methylated-DNA--[protein]-cysteine S-methyltransferase [uncultured Tepidimonas sp.]|uniref:methylated-DNA--[protein]-cysteine S-methyltransferase n=1 Tax=uncultured Tepidimonas sp. TaxID=453579 RepID=UPI0026310035|nr:methylated-DNA--[protein]-cysteine S-methyltransferase [uncultured Tepidimonas sp.]